VELRQRVEEEIDHLNPRLEELAEGESIGYAEIDPALARQKRIVLRPGAFEMDTIGDRRPELYGDLNAASSDPHYYS